MLKKIIRKLFNRQHKIHNINPKFKKFSFSRDYLPNYVANKLKTSIPLNIVEIGVEEGVYLDTYYPVLEKITKKFYLVDRWQYEGNEEFLNKFGRGKYESDFEKAYELVMSKYGEDEKVQICKGNSSDWAEKFDDEFFDYIYLDADHSKEGVLKDLIAWYPKLKKGGMISGHDTYCDPNNPTYSNFGVESAIEEFFDKDNWDRIYLTNEYAYKSWFYIKP